MRTLSRAGLVLLAVLTFGQAAHAQTPPRRDTAPAAGSAPASRGEAFQWLRRARTAALAGNASEAQRLAQAVLDMGRRKNDALVIAWAQQLTGEIAFAQRQGKEAFAAFTAALDGFSKLKDDSGAAVSHVNLGRILAAAGKPREALAHHQAALDLYAKQKKSAEMAAAWTDIAAAQRALEQPGEERAALVNALKLYQALEPRQPQGEFKVVLALGESGLAAGQIEPAVSHLQAAVELAEQLSDPAASADAKNSLGMAYQRQGQLDDALAAYQAALLIRTKQNPDPAAEAALHNNLGALHLERGAATEALAELKSAARLYEQLKDTSGQARAWYNLAIIHETQGQTAESIQAYEKTLALRASLPDKAGRAKVLDNLALLYAAQNQPDKAKALTAEAEKLRGGN